MNTSTLIRHQNIKLGILYGVVSALSFALMSVFVKEIGQQLPTSMLIFFLKVWLMLICIGIFGRIYQVSATLSYVTAPVRLMSPLIFLTVVFGGFFDWLIWNNIPNTLTIIGASMTILGAMITVYFGQSEIKK